MRWLTLLTWAAFLMTRCSVIHIWETVVFFHSKPVSNTFRGSVHPSSTNSSLARFTSKHVFLSVELYSRLTHLLTCLPDPWRADAGTARLIGWLPKKCFSRSLKRPLFEGPLFHQCGKRRALHRPTLLPLSSLRRVKG